MRSCLKSAATIARNRSTVQHPLLHVGGPYLHPYGNMPCAGRHTHCWNSRQIPALSFSTNTHCYNEDRSFLHPSDWAWETLGFYRPDAALPPGGGFARLQRRRRAKARGEIKTVVSLTFLSCLLLSAFFFCTLTISKLTISIPSLSLTVW